MSIFFVRMLRASGRRYIVSHPRFEHHYLATALRNSVCKFKTLNHQLWLSIRGHSEFNCFVAVSWRVHFIVSIAFSSYVTMLSGAYRSIKLQSHMESFLINVYLVIVNE